ncbi:MAG: dolichyl-phosphate beta-glucosyltransferase [Candidatus Paceibacterota bacterium]
MSIKLSVVIPAYNEEERLPSTLKSIDDYLTKQDYGYEILVVNDGSSDNTAQVTKELQSEIDNLKLIDNEKNHGKGYVVKQGLIEGRGDYRLFTDADNSTSVDQVEKMWSHVNEYDVIIGSRDLEGSVLDPPQSWFREHIIGAGFRLYRKLILDLWGLEDTQCGFKLFSKEAAEEVVPKCKIDGFAFDPEMLILAKYAGFKIKEIPVRWVNQEGSKVGLDSIFKMALDVLKIRWRLITKQYE